MTAFGEQPTQDLVAAGGREGELGATNNRLIGNSQTAQRNSAANLLNDTDPAQIDLKSANPTGLALNAAKKGLVDPLVKGLMSTNNGPRDAQLASAMALQGDPGDALINQLIGAMHGSNNSAALAQIMYRNATIGGNLLMNNAGREQYPELTVHRWGAGW